jgi:hypothetical protein
MQTTLLAEVCKGGAWQSLIVSDKSLTDVRH